jgi:hypothetical protein
MEPRIYTYKITFKGADFFYYGVHKEQKYGEEYWGSPVTHKDVWNCYEPHKEILSTFASWEEAKKAEYDLISPVLDCPLCLNENAGGAYSLEAAAKGGKIAGSLCKEQRRGFFAMTKEEWSEAGRRGGTRGGKKCFEQQKGIFGRTSEQIREHASKAGKIGGPIGGRNSKPGPEGRKKLSETAKKTLKNNPHIIQKFSEAGRIARRKQVKVICLATSQEEIFESISEACRVKKLTPSAVTGVLQGKFKHHKGFFFELLW